MIYRGYCWTGTSTCNIGEVILRHGPVLDIVEVTVGQRPVLVI